MKRFLTLYCQRAAQERREVCVGEGLFFRVSASPSAERVQASTNLLRKAKIEMLQFAHTTGSNLSPTLGTICRSTVCRNEFHESLPNSQAAKALTASRDCTASKQA